MTIRDALKRTAILLSKSVDEGEAKAMAKLILEEVKHYTPTELYMYGDRTLTPDTEDRILQIVNAVNAGSPLQYVLGKAYFHGRDFVVNPSVLIPRPETSQLVDIILDDFRNRSDLSVLDIGTGSGCIAVCLAIDLKYADVSAIDISAAAIDVAKENAKRLSAKVKFYRIDAFKLDRSELGRQNFDIIVSNPPYVLKSELQSMDARVADHEPHTALFVGDDKPTEIYAAIISYAASHLNDGGRIYLEINPLCADDILCLFKTAGMHSGRIIIDYKGNARFAVADK